MDYPARERNVAYFSGYHQTPRTRGRGRTERAARSCVRANENIQWVRHGRAWPGNPSVSRKAFYEEDGPVGQARGW